MRALFTAPFSAHAFQLAPKSPFSYEGLGRSNPVAGNAAGASARDRRRQSSVPSAMTIWLQLTYQQRVLFVLAKLVLKFQAELTIRGCLTKAC